MPLANVDSPAAKRARPVSPSHGRADKGDGAACEDTRWCPDTLRSIQKQMLYLLERQTSAQTLIVCDPIGGIGMTTMAMSLVAAGQALRCPGSVRTGQQLMQFVAPRMRAVQPWGPGGRPIIFLELGQAPDEAWSSCLAALDDVKQGLLYHPSCDKLLSGPLALVLVTCRRWPSDDVLAPRKHIMYNVRARAAAEPMLQRRHLQGPVAATPPLRPRGAAGPLSLRMPDAGGMPLRPEASTAWLSESAGGPVDDGCVSVVSSSEFNPSW